MRYFQMILMVCATMLSGSVGWADGRIALVIGNSSYQNATSLANPKNDAEAMGDKLEALGFQVMRYRDLDGQGMRMALGQFTEAALGAEIALVFYAGHGIEMGGENFLIPVDARMSSEATAKFETLSLNDVISSVQLAGRLGIVMVDACRDNPFGATMVRNTGTRSMSRGLAPVSVEGKDGLIVSFAAQEGNTADDGDGMHSPYTEAVLNVIDEPGLEIGRLFRKVRAQVRDTTGGRQIPVERMQLPDEAIFLVPGDGLVPVAPQPPANLPSGPDPMAMFLDAVQSNDPGKLSAFVTAFPDHASAPAARALMVSLQDDAFWQQIVAEDSLQAYRRYLIAFADGHHRAEAERRIAALQTPVPVPVPTPTPQPRAGPSFDCARASTLVEHTICSVGTLAALDLELAQAYTDAPLLASFKLEEQRKWIQERDAVCTGKGWRITDCLADLADTRINALQRGVTSGTVTPGFDCFKASTPTEHAICRSDVLARQDWELLNAYQTAKDRNWPEANDQRAFIKNREAGCSGLSGHDVALCAATMTAQRISVLTRQF